MNNEILHKIIKEEISKADVEKIVNSKLSSTLDSRDFKKTVKELATDVVSEVFRTLWQKNNFWRHDAERV